jgi:hypothetical protein
MSVSIAGNGRTTGLVGFRFVGTRYFESSGSFEKADPLGTGDIGLRAIRVRLVGAGGGSGGAPATTSGQISIAGSGGGGAYGETFITDIAGLSSTETITRGAGGTAAAAGGAGGDGGQTSAFGLTADGGQGGGAGTAGTPAAVVGGAPGAGGDVTGFDLNIPGSPAILGQGYATDRLLISIAGASHIGPQRVRAAVFASPAVAVAGSGIGSGGRGSANTPSQSALVGAAGANGIVIIDCFV